jgi:hypothetical protein
LIGLVNSYSHRWENLEIAVAPQLLRCFDGLSKSKSILKTLILSPVGFSIYQPGTFKTGATYPSPTCVILSPSYAWPLEIRWNNVTHFTGRNINIGSALEIFQLSPQLQECSLVELWTRGEDTPLTSPILHACLVTLHVDVNSALVAMQLLDTINLPLLKTFGYSGGSDFALPSDNMVAFLNRSGCLLETLSLQYAEMAYEEIILLLFAMPHLETLTLGPNPHNLAPYITDRMLNTLADTASISARLNDQPDSPFLPWLRSLIYTGWVTFSWKCIPSVVGREIKEPNATEPPKCDQRPLRSFRMELYFDPDRDQGLDANVAAELKRLSVGEGYEIQILDVIAEVHRDLLTGEPA